MGLFTRWKANPAAPAELPTWARRAADGFVEVDPDKAYPHYLKKLGNAAPDQYWLEVARRCFTEDLRRAASRPGKALMVRILRSPKWRLDRASPGKGAARGAAEFRRHYRRLQ